MLSLNTDDTLSLPYGVGYPLAAHQMLQIELHTQNLTGAPLPASATTTLTATTNADLLYESAMFVGGTRQISLSPQIGSNAAVYVPWNQPATAQIFALTGMQHRYGTDLTVRTSTGPSDTSGSIIFDTTNAWSQPATLTLTSPLAVAQNAGLSLTCSWLNTTMATVSFGTSFAGEVCFLVAFYYTNQGSPTYHFCLDGACQ
jgi:hypothetical protein